MANETLHEPSAQESMLKTFLTAHGEALQLLEPGGAIDVWLGGYETRHEGYETNEQDMVSRINEIFKAAQPSFPLPIETHWIKYTEGAVWLNADENVGKALNGIFFADLPIGDDNEGDATARVGFMWDGYFCEVMISGGFEAVPILNGGLDDAGEPDYDETDIQIRAEAMLIVSVPDLAVDEEGGE